MNIIALVGGLVGLVSGIFGILLMTVPEFVEVFVKLEGADDKVSDCAIGNLGVFQASFDSSCLGAETLAKTDFASVEAFESSTTEFKLLFPAQTDFMKEVNPLAERAAEEGIPFKEFKGDCEKYYKEQQTNQIGIWNFGTTLFLDSTAASIAEPVYGGLLNGTSQLIAGPVEIIIGTVEGIAIAGFGAQGVKADTTLDTLVGGNPTQVPLQAALVGASGAIEIAVGSTPLNLTTVVKDVVNDGVKTAIAESLCSTLTIRDCLTSYFYEVNTLEFVKPLAARSPALTLSSPLDSNYMSLFPSVVKPNPSPADVALVAGAAAQGAKNFFSDAALLAPPEDAKALSDGWGAIAILLSIGTGDNAYLTALTTSDTSNFVTALSGELAKLPSAFAGAAADPTAEWKMCNFFKAVMGDDFTAQPGTACGVLSLLAPIGEGNSNLVNFLGARLAGGDTTIATEDIEQVGSFGGLFGLCYQNRLGAGVSGPGECATKFFHNYVLSGTYTFAIDFNATTEAVVEEAIERCEDDLLDASAIENAQLLTPIATGAAFVGSIAGLVAAKTENKIVSLVAAVLSLLAGVLSLVALLGVYNAPVYENVASTEVPEDYGLVYKSGKTVLFGLVNIGTAFVAGIILLISVKFGGQKPEAAFDEKKEIVNQV